MRARANQDVFDFIRTCDAMVHARREGETFGLAVAEFAVRNKPVLTANLSFRQSTLAHVHHLGAKAILYTDAASLLDALLSFNRTDAASRDWRAYTEFEPHMVMRRFREVFLSGSEHAHAGEHSHRDGSSVREHNGSSTTSAIPPATAATAAAAA